MPIGTCDPATRGEPYNVTTLEYGGGAITIDVRWDWDGVSTKGPYQWHTVAGADTLASIATQYDVTQAKLIEWNGLVEPFAVNPGQVLIVRQGCDGPIRRIRTTNNDVVSWYIHTTGRRNRARDIEIPAGDVRIWNAARLTSAGYDTISDLENLTLSTSPTRAQVQQVLRDK